MLIRFNVGNFLSFKDVQEFSMIAGKVRKKEEHLLIDANLKLLKFAAIFGANASGKSNFVKAIEFAKEMIIDKGKIKQLSGYFKLDHEYKEKESYFEFEFLLNKKYYSYGFEIILDRNEFVSEWLIELLPNDEKKIIFERDIKNEGFRTELHLPDEKLNTQFNVYADAIRAEKNILFLNEINRNKSHLYKEQSELNILKDVLTWFTFSLNIDHPFNSISDFSYFQNTDRELILNIIKSFGIGITNYNIVELSLEKIKDRLPEALFSEVEDRINELLADQKRAVKGTMTLKSSNEFYIINIETNKKVKVTTVEFEHGNKAGKEYSFAVSEESDGTRRIIELIQILLSEENKTYIIDEIDRSLHPQLTYRFVENMLKIASKKNIQLIITTHESRLLDFGLLRQDEIWLMDKNKSGESKLYSLDEYNVRFDQKIDKAYLEGRYGGVPVFTTIFPVRED